MANFDRNLFKSSLAKKITQQRISPTEIFNKEKLNGLWAGRLVKIFHKKTRAVVILGWKPDDRLTNTPKPQQKSLHPWETNCGPLLETISNSIPCSRKTWFTRWSAVSLAEDKFGRATKRTALENLSTIVAVIVFPCDRGKLMTKSNDLCASLWDNCLNE